MIKFKTWINRFIDDNTPFGDLARDINSDENFPKENKYSIILAHLDQLRACDDAISTFKDAWVQYGGLK